MCGVGVFDYCIFMEVSADETLTHSHRCVDVYGRSPSMRETSYNFPSGNHVMGQRRESSQSPAFS